MIEKCSIEKCKIGLHANQVYYVYRTFDLLFRWYYSNLEKMDTSDQPVSATPTWSKHFLIGALSSTFIKEPNKFGKI